MSAMPRTWWSPTAGLVQDVPTALYLQVATGEPMVAVPEDAVELFPAGLPGRRPIVPAMPALAAGEPTPRPGDRLDADGFVWRQESGGCWHMATTTAEEGECSPGCPSTLAFLADTSHAPFVEVTG